MEIHEWMHPLVKAFFPTLAFLVIAGSMACALALATRRLLVRRLRPASRFVLLALALMVPVLLAALVPLPVDQIKAQPEVEAVTADVAAPELAAAAAGTPLRGEGELHCIAITIWLSGALVLLLIELLRIARSASPAPAGGNHQLADQLRESLAPLPCPLVIAPGCSDPRVEGFVRSRIVLPEEFAVRLDPAELRSVIAHEVHHVERRDNVIAAVLRAAASLFWFDPLRWLTLRAAMDERERACDEHVLRKGHQPSTYIAAVLKSCGGPARATSACVTSSRIGERMDAIMNFAHSAFVSHRAARAVFLTIFVAAAAVAAIWIPRPLIAAASASAGSPSAAARSIVRPDGTIEVQALIRNANGDLISAPTMVVPAGDEATFSSSHAKDDQKIEYRVTTRPHREGRGTALFEVLENDRVVHSTRIALMPLKGVAMPADGAPMNRSSQQPSSASAPLPGEEQYAELKPGSGISPARVISRAEPTYPPEARPHRVSGIVITRLLIDENGIVQGARVLKGLPFGMNEAALDSVRQWRFEPATKDGVPVKTVFHVSINFRVNDQE